MKLQLQHIIIFYIFDKNICLYIVFSRKVAGTYTLLAGKYLKNLKCVYPLTQQFPSKTLFYRYSHVHSQNGIVYDGKNLETMARTIKRGDQLNKKSTAIQWSANMKNLQHMPLKEKKKKPWQRVQGEGHIHRCLYTHRIFLEEHTRKYSQCFLRGTEF